MIASSGADAPDWVVVIVLIVCLFVAIKWGPPWEW